MNPTLTFTLPPLPRPPRLGWRGRTAVGLVTLLALYGIGFGVFVATLPSPFTTLPPHLEGLATFTGGAGRVQALLHQINAGFSGPILISGMKERTPLRAVLHHAQPESPISPAQADHILQDTAQTTRQNVESLKVWAAYLGITRIGIITSTYHTHRVRLLGRALAPELTLTLLPVQPADAGLRPLLREYNKLLLSPILP